MSYLHFKTLASSPNKPTLCGRSDFQNTVIDRTSVPYAVSCPVCKAVLSTRPQAYFVLAPDKEILFCSTEGLLRDLDGKWVQVVIEGQHEYLPHIEAASTWEEWSSEAIYEQFRRYQVVEVVTSAGDYYIAGGSELYIQGRTRSYGETVLSRKAYEDRQAARDAAEKRNGTAW